MGINRSVDRALRILCGGVCALVAGATQASGPSYHRVRHHRPKHQPLYQAKPAPAVYGPPLPADRATITVQAGALRAAISQGRAILLHGVRDTEQIAFLEHAGTFLWPPAPVKETARTVPALPSRHAPPGFRQDAPPADLPEPALPEPPCTQPSSRLMHMLNALAAHSRPARPLVLMSLLRPPYQTPYFVHAGPVNPHSLGLAADIGAYGGHTIRNDRPEECVAATLALIRDLPAGRYRLGVPRAPEAPAIVGEVRLAGELVQMIDAVRPVPEPAAPERVALPIRHARTVQARPDPPCGICSGAAIGCFLGIPQRPWPFFPEQQVEMLDGVVAAQRGAQGRPVAHIIRFRNESYAPLSALHDPRLRAALAAARRRGVDIFGLFPDGPDHMHVDVKEKL